MLCMLCLKVKVLLAQLCLTLCDPMDCSPPDSSDHGIFQARILEWVAISFSRGFFRPSDRTWVSCIAGRFFYRLSHQGCLLNDGAPVQNTGVGSHSLLQQIFPTQGLNPALPHCRRILYQLSHQGSPRILERIGCSFSQIFPTQESNQGRFINIYKY